MCFENLNRFKWLLAAWIVVLASNVSFADSKVIRAGYVDVGWPSGFSRVVDGYKAVFKALGYEMEVDGYPNFRSLIMTSRGQIDLEFARYPSVINSFPDLVMLEVPVVSVSFSLIQPKDQPRIRHAKELQGKKVVAFKGIKFFATLQEKYPDIEFIFVENKESISKILSRSRADMAFVPYFWLNAYQVPLGFKVELDQIYTYSYGSIHSSKSHLKEKIEQQMKFHFPLKLSRQQEESSYEMEY